MRNKRYNLLRLIYVDEYLQHCHRQKCQRQLQSRTCFSTLGNVTTRRIDHIYCCNAQAADANTSFATIGAFFAMIML
jgi:hypothetical protein